MRSFSHVLCAGLVLCFSAGTTFAQEAVLSEAALGGIKQASGDCANGNCAVGSGGPVAFGRSGCYGSACQTGGCHGGGCLSNHTFGVSAANCNYRQYGPHDLFRPYYAPNNCGGPVASLYPAPHPVPPHVGHTYYTYQPLYPHEFLYPHHRTYHRYYDDGRGLTRTSVKWMR